MSYRSLCIAAVTLESVLIAGALIVGNRSLSFSLLFSLSQMPALTLSRWILGGHSGFPALSFAMLWVLQSAFFGALFSVAKWLKDETWRVRW